MNLPNPADLLPQMARDLQRHLANRGIAEPRSTSCSTTAARPA